MKYKYIAGLFCLCLLLCNLSIIPVKHAQAGNNNIIIPDRKAKNNSMAGYKIKEDKKEFKDKKGNVRCIVAFQYPQFTSTSPAAVKINRQLKKKSRQYFKSENFKNIKKYTKDAIKYNRFSYKTDQYLWTTYCSMSYNKDNIVSFQMAEWWYAGGVTTRDYYGLNYNLDTGKELEIKDVIKGNAKTEILKAAKKYLKGDKEAYKIIKDTKKYKFYFEKGTVYICYGGYELNRGPGFDIFTVKIPDINKV